MKKAYVITEGRIDADLLRRLLPKDISDNAEFVVGSGRYSAQSLARSILATKHLPVALVLDAETYDEGNITEQIDFLRELLGEVSPDARFEVFLATPALERSILEYPSFAEWYGRYVSTPRAHNRRSPGMHIEEDIGVIERVPNNLDSEMIKVVRRHPLVSELTKFLSSVIGQSG